MFVRSLLVLSVVLLAPGPAQADRGADFVVLHQEDPDPHAPPISDRPGYWDGDMYVGPDSGSVFHLGEGMTPTPASNYEATPGVLYVAANGVTLKPYCGNGDSANGALNCSPLVDKETNFPSYGSSSQQAALEQTLKGYYADFDLIITRNRPPAYLPYTMAVVGGSASNAGQGGGTCGIANVACDGLKRNHVSLTFPSSCGGVAAIVAQETSHNWGLEHTDNSSDLLYPYANGGSKSFIDSCMNISHATGNGVTACTYIHEIYCPNGGGEQQNSYAELMGVFGPRTPDSTAPVIASISPEDGSTFTSDDTFTVTATVEENSNFAGVRWTWTEGVPEEVANAEGTFTKCTNKTCDDAFNLGLDIDFSTQKLDFITLNKPPPGTYTFEFEVMDAYGNSDQDSITVTVTGDGSETGGNPTTTTAGTTSDGTSATSGGTTGDGTSGTTGDGTTTDEPTTGFTTMGLTTSNMDDDDPKGCGCRQAPRPAPGLMFLAGLLPLAFGRRRRAAGPSRRG